MAVDGLQMAIAVLTAAALPVIARRRLGFGALGSFLIAEAGANLLTHALPYAIHPQEHYGPAYAVAILMYLAIITLIAGTATLLSNRNQESGR